MQCLEVNFQGANQNPAVAQACKENPVQVRKETCTTLKNVIY